MEKLSQAISVKRIESPHDKLQEITLEAFINSDNMFSQPQSHEVINFSNLDFDKLLILFEKNEKLRKDYFKFGLYSMLDEEKATVFFGKFECPYSANEKVSEFINGFKNQKLVEVFILKNARLLNEKMILELFKNILSLQISNTEMTYLIFKLIENSPVVDKNYSINLLKQNKNLRLLPDETVESFKILSVIIETNKENTETINKTIPFLTIILDLILMFYSQNKISEEEFNQIQEKKEILRTANDNILKSKNEISQYEINKILKYSSAISQDDFIIEKIKI